MKTITASVEVFVTWCEDDFATKEEWEAFVAKTNPEIGQYAIDVLLDSNLAHDIIRDYAPEDVVVEIDDDETGA